jgi:hypothetical protein
MLVQTELSEHAIEAQMGCFWHRRIVEQRRDSPRRTTKLHRNKDCFSGKAKTCPHTSGEECGGPG